MKGKYDINNPGIVEIEAYGATECRILCQEFLQIPLTDVSVNAFEKIKQNVNNEGSDLNEKEGNFGI
jgi:hypothetical protein